MDKQIEAVARQYDRSARTNNRVAAVHFTDKGKPVDESVYDDIFSQIDHLIHFAPTDTVLEIGAGSGLLLERIASKVKTAFGTDISAEILKMVPPLNNITVRQMNSDRLEFQDQTFDRVVCYGVSLYFPDNAYAKKCLAEMMRVCRPGGAICIGDVLNGDLERAFWSEENRLQPTSVKLKRLAYKLLNKGGHKYFFIRPHDLYQWSKDLGCRDFGAHLILNERKPLFHRMFRYDAVIYR